MALERRSYTPAEEIALTMQVERCCPLCGTALFYKKKGRTYRYYELNQTTRVWDSQAAFRRK